MAQKDNRPAKYISAKEAAARIGCSKSTLHHHLRLGRFNIRRMGRDYYLDPSSVEAFIAAKAAGQYSVGRPKPVST